jgi:hypothetical protein
MKMNGKQQESSLPSRYLRKGGSALWFEPNGDNHVVIERLIARFKSHKQPGYLIDVLTVGEALAVYAYMRHSVGNYLGATSFWYLSDQLLTALPWLAYEIEQQELQLKDSIYKVLTSSVIQQMHDSSDDPRKLAASIVQILVLVKKETARANAYKKNTIYHEEFKKAAVKFAAEKWKQEPKLTKDAMAKYVQDKLPKEFNVQEGKSKKSNFAFKTIKAWIDPAMPLENKKPGRRPRH